MTKEHKSLEVDNFANLANKEYEHIDPLIKNFLPGVGLFLLCGGLKVGKSLMALDIGSHICTGLPFWGYEVRQADVLYLCLEDGEERLQDRMFTIASECSENFYYAIEASALEDDLIEQLQEQKNLHPDLGLIIIDTLAAIRSEQNASNGNAYLADYKILNSLHEFAQENHIAVLVIHHVRKMKSSEPFDDIVLQILQVDQRKLRVLFLRKVQGRLQHQRQLPRNRQQQHLLQRQLQSLLRHLNQQQLQHPNQRLLRLQHRSQNLSLNRKLILATMFSTLKIVQ